MDKLLKKLQNNVRLDPNPENVFKLNNYYTRLGKDVTPLSQMALWQDLKENIFSYFGIDIKPNEIDSFHKTYTFDEFEVKSWIIDSNNNLIIWKEEVDSKYVEKVDSFLKEEGFDKVRNSQELLDFLMDDCDLVDLVDEVFVKNNLTLVRASNYYYLLDNSKKIDIEELFKGIEE